MPLIRHNRGSVESSVKSVHSAVITPVVTALLVTACFASFLISAEKTYSPKSGDETEILSLVLKAEVQANSWTKNEMICFSVEGIDPSPNLVRTLRQRDLNVRSSAEWAWNAPNPDSDMPA